MTIVLLIFFVFIPIILVMVYLNIQVNDFEKKYLELEGVLKSRFKDIQETPEAEEIAAPKATAKEPVQE